jgi:fructokinase
MPTAFPHLGVDLGGTKTEIVALTAEGSELHRQRASTPRGDYEATVALVGTLVDAAEHALGFRSGSCSVGVGTPGAPSRASGLMRNCNSTWLNGRPLPRDLALRLRRPVAVANDANCFALSEARDGAGAGGQVVFGVILGTGVGGGIVVQLRVLEGANGIAGEWGHNPLPWPDDDERPGPSCYCGRSGCIEVFLSGPGLARDHAAAAGTQGDPASISAAAAAGDPIAQVTMQRYESRLARGLAHVINVLDPDIVVLGGGLSNIERLYRHVPRLWQRWIFSDRVDTPLVRNRHGDSSGVRGAAWLGAAAGHVATGR